MEAYMSLDNIYIIFFAVIVILLYFWIDSRLVYKLVDDKRRFKSGEMTEPERSKYIAKQLKSAEDYFRLGKLTLFDLEAVKRYYGQPSMLDSGGIAFTRAASNKLQAEHAIKQHQKKSERDLIFQTTVGDAINGLPGAIIGATESIKKSAKEAAALEASRAVAENEYRKALEDIGKR